ncbi:MAG: type VI secretion system baseplate subunit TssK [Limnobacter sp.]|nr:type VI secretion system baseplate subunit TssK [Limnobacter sp.]
MSRNNRVLWSDGLFLQATHFQQQERFLEHQIHQRHRLAQPWFTGFETLQLCSQSLKTGTIRLLKASGFLNNGMFFDAPGECPAPASLSLRAQHKNLNVYLLSADNPFKAFSTQTIELHNSFEENPLSEQVDLAVPTLELMAAKEPPNGYAWLKVAEVLEIAPTGEVILDESYQPPFIWAQNSSFLKAMLDHTLILLKQKIESIQQHAIRNFQNSAQLSDFLMLQTCLRHQGVFEHYGHSKGLHPEHLYRAYLGLLGDLSLFDPTIGKQPEMIYEHLDQFATFDRLFKSIAELLAISTEKRAIAIALERRSHGLRLGQIGASLAQSSPRLVLCVRGDLPFGELSARLLNTLKVGSASHIHELINLNLPGITLTQLTQAPRELPTYADFLYFELQVKACSHWKLIQQSLHIAVHCSDQLPGLNMELWAIKSPERSLAS